MSDYLYRNVKQMHDELTKSKGVSYDEAYELLCISAITHRRWKNSVINPKRQTAEALLDAYNRLFLPPINDFQTLRNHYIEEMHLKNPESQTKIDRFLGDYYLYYFSDHYKNEIHGGKLSIYKDNIGPHVKMIIGIIDQDRLENKTFLEVFKKAEESFDLFIKYKDEQKTYLNRRCYYYSGDVLVDNNLLEFKLNGSENRNTHREYVFFDLKRIITETENTTGNPRTYKGGLGIVFAFPNKQHRDMRMLRLGISRWKIDYKDERLKKILSHRLTSNNRLIVSEEDDRRWFDLMILYEQ